MHGADGLVRRGQAPGFGQDRHSGRPHTHLGHARAQRTQRDELLSRHARRSSVPQIPPGETGQVNHRRERRPAAGQGGMGQGRRGRVHRMPALVVHPWTRVDRPVWWQNRPGEHASRLRQRQRGGANRPGRPVAEFPECADYRRAAVGVVGQFLDALFFWA